MGTHFFIDETKAKSYVVVAVACPDASLSTARRTIGNLILPGQRSIHMKNESARRRGQIADAVRDLEKVGVSAVVVDAGRGPEPEHARRARAQRAVVDVARHSSAATLVVDVDWTLVSRDARSLATAIRELSARSVTYSHQPLAAQPLLALPDVIAWSWARGGDWRRRVAPVIAKTMHV